MSDWQMPERPARRERIRKPRRGADREVEPLNWEEQPAAPARAVSDPGNPLAPQARRAAAPASSAPARTAISASGPTSAPAPVGAVSAVSAGSAASAAVPATTAVPPGAWPEGGLAPARETAEVPAVRTGPSGLLLGTGTHGPVSIRLFRPTPTRLAMAVPDYVAWLLAYRCISLGAHLSIFADDQRRWSGLLDAVRTGGGTGDLLGPGDTAPAAGRPYRPSVVVDDADFYDGLANPLGPWQALLTATDVTAASSVFTLRSCEMALVAPVNAKVAENLRRAYNLSAHQLRACQDLADHEVALAMPRRVVKIAIPPTKLEYAELFVG